MYFRNVSVRVVLHCMTVQVWRGMFSSQQLRHPNKTLPGCAAGFESQRPCRPKRPVLAPPALQFSGHLQPPNISLSSLCQMSSGPSPTASKELVIAWFSDPALFLAPSQHPQRLLHSFPGKTLPGTVLQGYPGYRDLP